MDLSNAVRLLDAGIADRLHLGAQLFVARAGDVIADLAVGETRPGQPLTTDTLMMWLSSTKPVAAIAIAQLWERGLLGLDDPVAAHVPEFAANGKGGITLRHLLTHTGGIRMLDVGWPAENWDAIVARICQMRPEPRWPPGGKAGYHQQSSWFLLGEIVQRLSGQPFSTYVRAAILEPLGMLDCWVGMPAERFHAYGERIATMFDTEATPPKDQGWDRAERVVTCAPGSNGVGPMRQLARMYQALLAGGALDGARILLPQTVEAIVARHRAGMFDHTFRCVMDWGLGFIPTPAIYDQPDVPYAYGRHASRRAFGHSGYRSSAAFADPEHGLVVALAVNGTPSDVAHRQRFRAILEAIYEDLGLAAVPPPAPRS